MDNDGTSGLGSTDTLIDPVYHDGCGADGDLFLGVVVVGQKSLP